VSTPTPLPPFATVPQYEELTGQTAPPGTADALAGASAAIRRYCGWHIAPVINAVLTLDGPGTRILMLPTLRMVDLNAVTEIARDGTTYDLLPDVDLEWSINGTVRKRSGGWFTTVLRGLVVDLDHGFAMEDVADLTQVVLNMVARNLSNPYGVTAQAVGGVSISSGPGPGGQVGGLVVFPEQAAQLQSYRLERWP
jgi:hypothetical protein